MVSRTLMRKARRDLMARKGAVLSLIAIVMIGVASFTSMTSVYRDLDSARAAYYSDNRLADFTIDLKRAPKSAVKEGVNTPNVRELRGRISLSIRSELPNIDLPISGLAISMPREPKDVINGVVLRTGTWFSTDTETLVDEKFAEAHGLIPGNRIKVLLLDKEHELLITGTVLSPEFVYKMPPGGGIAPDPARFAVFYMDEQFLAESGDLEGAYNQIIGTTNDYHHDAVVSTLGQLESKLDAYGVTNLTAQQEQVSVRFLRDDLTGLNVSSILMPCIFLGVGALILNVMMKRLVTQQRSIIGTLKALGYSSAAVTRHYLGYGVIIGIVGSLLGTALGRGLQLGMLRLFKQVYALPSVTEHFYLDLQLVGLLISIVCASLGTIRGVLHASRLMPAEAMAPPPPEKGGRVLPEYISFLWQRFTFRQKMILRSIFRNPFRSAVSVCAATVATALIFSALSMVSSLDYLIHFEFDKVSHEDVTVSIRDPRETSVRSEIRLLRDVSEIEPQLTVMCDVSNGIRKKRIGLTGLIVDNQLHTPLDQKLRPIRVPESGVVLSAKLAEVLKVQPGESISLRALVGERKRVQALVVGTVDTFLGLSAYANMGYLSQLLGEEMVSSTFLVRTYSHDLQTNLLEEIKKFPVIVGISERIRSFIQMEATFQKSIGAMISIMVFLSGTIAFGSVLNTALVSVSERQREIGTLRVIGYSSPQVSTIFCGESLLINLLGIFFGLFSGIGLAFLLAMAYNTEIYRFPAIICARDLLVSAILMLFFVVLAQGIVFRLIAKLNWLEALSIKE